MRALRSRLGLLGTLALAAAHAGAQPVGSEFQINTYTTSNQRTGDDRSFAAADRSVAADANGNFVVVWSGRGKGDGYGIFGQRYDSAGGVLGSEFRVNSFTEFNQSLPSVAADASGNFVVVWGSFQYGSEGEIFAQRYDHEGGTLGSEFRVNSNTPGHQEHPSVASDASGNFVVVWNSVIGYGQGDILGQRYDSGGVPRGDEFRVSTTAGAGPAVASDASANFVVVWHDLINYGNYYNDSFGQRFDNEGVAQGTEFRIPQQGESYVPSVAHDASGNFVVVWSGSGQGDAVGIFGQRYDSEGEALGSQFRVNSYRAGPQTFPSVASDTSGNFVVAWKSTTDQDEDGGVFGQRYDSAGVAQGSEFRINSYTTGQQRSSSVWVSGTNQFVVAWTSDGQDGDGDGVFGQRFSFDGGDTVTVVSPNTNVKWRIGSLETIKWTHNLGRGETFRIQLDRDDDGSFEELIGAEAPADADTRGHFAWTVTGPLSPAARVRVSWTTNPDVSDTSDVTFQIRPVPLGATQGTLER